MQRIDELNQSERDDVEKAELRDVQSRLRYRCIRLRQLRI